MSQCVAALGDVAEITSGFAFQSSHFNTDGEGLPLVRIRDVVPGVSDTYYRGTFKNEYVVANGDALIGMDGEFNLGIWRGGPALLNQRVCRVRAQDDRLDNGYLLRFLPNALKAIEDATPFVTVKHLSIKNLREIDVPLPPLPEQRRIAAILDKADALRAKRREAIGKLDQLLQAVFLDMFGDPVTNPKGWPTRSFTEVGRWTSGSTPDTNEEEYWDGSIPWVSPKDMKVPNIFDAQDHVSEKAFSQAGLRSIAPGHLLIVIRGMILAHSFPTAINMVRIGINQDMKAILPADEYNVIYLKAVVDALKARILSVVSTAGHGTKRLDLRDASEVAVPMPPRDLQAEFSEIAASIRRQSEHQIEQAVQQVQLSRSLQHLAFG
ncbi:MAG: restriction endonuclease subunit S [Nevskia sp.]|nr:restriction endonuclease subunit S [Nevskia sp.]